MLTPAFNQQSPRFGRFSPLFLAFWAVSIDSDRQAREKEHRRRIQAAKDRQHRMELRARAYPAPRP